MSWNRKHLLDIESLSAEEITLALDTAKTFKAVGERAIKVLSRANLNHAELHTQLGSTGFRKSAVKDARWVAHVDDEGSALSAAHDFNRQRQLLSG